MHGHKEKNDLWTIQELIEWTAQYFTGKGIPSPRLDAELLLACALNADRLFLYLNLAKPISPSERQAFRALVQRRAQREPVAYITGRREFWSLNLDTQRGVLIPRPETETLVEYALKVLTGAVTPLVLDMGSGTGAIALALARERPDATIVAVDINPRAAQLTRDNARKLDCSDTVHCVVGDLFPCLRDREAFDVICSNPPYIPTAVVGTLAPEIAGYEPNQALDGGPDGLDYIRLLARGTGSRIKPGGRLIVEIGDEQGHEARAILQGDGGLSDVHVLEDLAGKPRVVTGTKPQSSVTPGAVVNRNGDRHDRNGGPEDRVLTDRSSSGAGQSREGLPWYEPNG